MKKLNDLKKVSCMNRFSLLIIAIGLAIGFTSCGNDDDDTQAPKFSVKDVEGSYTGKVLTLTPQPQNRSTGEPELGVDINAVVKDNNLFFNKFPVADLIQSILGDEAAAPIIEAIGDVEYQVPFVATLNESKNDIITLSLTPKPLVINFELPAVTEGEEPTPFKIEVKITTDKQGTFTYASQKLELALLAEEVIVNDIPFEGFLPTTFQFNLNKK